LKPAKLLSPCRSGDVSVRREDPSSFTGLVLGIILWKMEIMWDFFKNLEKPLFSKIGSHLFLTEKEERARDCLVGATTS